MVVEVMVMKMKVSIGTASVVAEFFGAFEKEVASLQIMLLGNILWDKLVVMLNHNQNKNQCYCP